MVHLICTFEEARIPFLPQFVEHYRHLGAEHFHLSLQIEPEVETKAAERALTNANEALRPYGFQLLGPLIVPFSSYALRAHHDTIATRSCTPEDWIVWADIDEFQVYPGDFRSLLQLGESLEIDYFRGEFVDRITDDGKLHPFNPVEPIWTQFPRRCKISAEFTGCVHKITCARQKVRISPGNHYAINEHPLRYYADPVDIHHFKWDATVVSRLSRRLQPDFKERCPWWVESKSILDFIALHGGCVEEQV